MSARWLILGAGYAGARLARALVQSGEEVWATVRDIDQAMALEGMGVGAVVADFQEIPQQALAEVRPTIAVLSIPPAREPEGEAIEANAIAWAKAQGATSLIYWSSTSVYGSSEGAVVDETTPCAPNTEVGRRRYAAEERVRAACAAEGIACAIVRIVGIYGPGRNMKQRLERGDYVMADGGNLWSNRVHVDDIVGATRWIVAQDTWSGLWLLSDGESFRVRELIEWLCGALDLPLPPSVPLASMDARRRAFWTGDRRVDARRLRTSGWRSHYPNYRVGMQACWDEEQGIACNKKPAEKDG